MRKQTLRAAERIRRSISQTVTPLGWVLIAAAVVGAVLGAAYGWLEAWTVAVVGGVLVLAALPFLLGSRAYRVRIDLPRRRVTAGDTVELALEVENSGARPALPVIAEIPLGPALREVTIPMIGPRGSARIPLEISAARRGVVRVGPLTIARRDPLGILRREITWPERHQLIVRPKFAHLPPQTAGLVRDLEGAPSRKLADSDLSFYAVREYERGDAMRHVHWKSTAKTGTLMVRQYEESQTARVAVLFDVRPEEYRSDEEFELGVSVAASVSVQSVREGRDRFIASAWTPRKIPVRVDGLEELPSRETQELLDAWAGLEQVPEAPPCDELARSLAHARRDLSVVVIITGAEFDLTRVRRAAASFAPDVQVVAMRAELHAEPDLRRLERLSVFTVGALQDLPQLMMRGAR